MNQKSYKKENNFDEMEVIEKKEIIMENHITYILHETILGLKYIHENVHAIHRDIKAGNILLDSLGNGTFLFFIGTNEIWILPTDL